MPTQNVLLHDGDWDDETRASPALKFMEKYAHMIDSREHFNAPASDWHSSNFSFQKSTGQTVQGADAAWKGVAEVYLPFSAHHHQPTFLVSWQTDKGWTMVGTAFLWWNLAAPGDQAKVKDANGKEWDGVTPAMYRFEYVDEGGDVKLARTELYSDPSQTMVYMLKRGMLKSEDLMAM